MEIKFKKIYWTEHSKIKMKQYGLSKIKLLNLIHKPERVEEGIVPGTVALMRTNQNKGNTLIKNNLKLPLKNKFSQWKPQKKPGEVWLMYKDDKDERKIISAWRYPGATKPGEQIPVPADIMAYIESLSGFK